MFLISADVYKIIKPDSSSKWARGSTKLIKWDKKRDPYPDIKIRLYTSPGKVIVMDITKSHTNSESFSWKIPAGVALGKYFVKVNTLDNSNWGESKPFEIKKALMVVINKDVLKKVKGKPQFKPTPGMFNPEIESYFDIPMGPLRAGTKLFLKGKKFGTQKGKILLKGNFPGGQIELTNVTWGGDESANGFIPLSAEYQPDQKVEIILVTSLNFKSEPVKDIVFEGGRVLKLLQMSHVAVIHCGGEANHNECNPTSMSQHTIYGHHVNHWGTIGNDTGYDTYKIVLKNGWKLKSMTKDLWYKSSSDEVLTEPNPPFPVGASSWEPTFHWIVSPNDKVMYALKIIVEGPAGTDYN